MSTVPKMAGYRNVALLTGYLIWTLIVLKIAEPPGGYSPDLVYAMSTLLSWVGGVVVAAMFGRAANKLADRWEPRRKGEP